MSTQPLLVAGPAGRARRRATLAKKGKPVQTKAVECNFCSQAWENPRLLEAEKAASDPTYKCLYLRDMEKGGVQGFNPTPVVVCKQHFPDRLFKTLAFVQKPSGVSLYQWQLLSEFEYEDCLQLHSNLSSEKKYARIISLNLWYWDLFVAMIFMCLSVLDIQASVFYCIRIAGSPQHLFVLSVAGGYFLMVMGQMWIAWREACFEWEVKNCFLLGDLIKEGDWHFSFFALWMFRFFLVKKSVRDIVITLHPWKAKQPYAAVKLENTRAFVVGYQTKSVFELEQTDGQLESIRCQLVTKVIVLVMRVAIYLGVERGTLSLPGNKLSLVEMLLMSSFTVATMFWLLRTYMTTRSLRREACNYLKEQYTASKDDESKKVLRRQLLQYFRLKPDDKAKDSRCFGRFWCREEDQHFSRVSKQQFFASIHREQCDHLIGCITCGRKVTWERIRDNKHLREQLFRKYDADADGEINGDEFHELVDEVSQQIMDHVIPNEAVAEEPPKLLAKALVDREERERKKASEAKKKKYEAKKEPEESITFAAMKKKFDEALKRDEGRLEKISKTSGASNAKCIKLVPKRDRQAVDHEDMEDPTADPTGKLARYIKDTMVGWQAYEEIPLECEQNIKAKALLQMWVREVTDQDADGVATKDEYQGLLMQLVDLGKQFEDQQPEAQRMMSMQVREAFRDGDMGADGEEEAEEESEIAAAINAVEQADLQVVCVTAA